MTPAISGRERVPGLDTLRFFCALWVVFAHIPPFPTNQFLGKDNLLELALRGVLKNLFCGPAAVTVFFVISGFCIHFPQRNGRPLAWVAFYAQRFIRIGIPFAFAVTIGYLAGLKGLQIGWESFRIGSEHRQEAEQAASILWSLVAEMTYYALYPGLLWASRRIQWKGVFLLAILGALAVLATDPRARFFPHFGNSLTPILGLPSWLLGVFLAEAFHQFKDGTVSRPAIWAWRLGVIGSASALQALFFHPPSFFPYVGYPWTLQFYAVLAFFWLQREIQWWRKNSPVPVFEWLGGWSYSIYLFHVAAPPTVGWLMQLLGRPALPPLALALMRNLMVFPVCYLFARIVEFPSWTLARRVGSRLRESAAKGG